MLDTQASVFLDFLNMSINASWLILAVVLLRLLLKNAPKAVRCILWALVGIRLICPVSFESVISLIPSSETVPQEILFSSSPMVNVGIEAINERVNPVISQTLAPDTDSFLLEPTRLITIVASIIWIAGILILLIYAALTYIRLRRKVAASICLRDNICLCDSIDSPFILGIIKPKIYLPSAITESSSEYVIAHEKAHIKRRDHFWKPLGFILLAVYWFNPAIWAAYILLCRDIELACDEKVIKEMDSDDKKAYSQALLICSITHKAIAACPLAFGEVGVKERIKSVLSYKKPAFWIIIAAIIACVGVSVFFMTNPAGESIYDLGGDQFKDAVSVNLTSEHYGTYSITQEEIIKEIAEELKEIRYDTTPLSANRSSSESMPNSISISRVINGNFQVYTYYFDGSFATGCYDNTVKPTLPYQIKNPEKAKSLFKKYAALGSAVNAGVDYVEWHYEPMRSATFYYYFPIKFSINCDSIEAECTEGKLINYNVKYPEEIPSGQKLTFESSQALFWCPDAEGKEAAAKTEISFKIIRGGEELFQGIINIDRLTEVTSSASSATYGAYIKKSSGIISENSERLIIEQGDTGAIVSIESKDLKYDFYYTNAGLNYSSLLQGEIDPIINFAVNKSSLGISHTRHLPLVKLDSKNAFDFFVEEAKECYQLNSGYNEIPSFMSIADRFDNAFFEENVLFITYVEEPSGSYRHTLNNISVAGGTLGIEITKITPEVYTTDMSGSFICVAVDKETVSRCAEFDAWEKNTVSLGQTDALSVAIKSAIMQNNSGKLPNGFFACESHVVMVQASGSTTPPVEGHTNIVHKNTVYVYALYQKYDLSNQKINLFNEKQIHAKLDFDIDNNGSIILTDYRQLSDTESEDKIKDFYPSVMENVTEDLKLHYIPMKKDCYAQAVEYAGLDTDKIIGDLFDEIMNNSKSSSSPAEYLNANPERHNELIYYGDYTLKYIFSEFLKGGQTGLKGHLMRLVMDDLIAGEALKLYTDTGQEYFDTWYEHAKSIEAQQGLGFMKDNTPKMWLLMQMV